MNTFLLILLLAVVFVVGQVTLLRPSRRDKHLMALRAEARRLGFDCRLQAAPAWFRGERPAGGLLACYTVFSSTDKPLPYFRAERRRDGHWEVGAGASSVLAALTLPPEAESLLALEMQVNAASLWWTESLGAEALPALQQLLQSAMAAAALPPSGGDMA